MDDFLLVVGYIAAFFVLLVQPVRLLWGLYMELVPPKDRYLNRSVLGISLFIKALSLLLAVYLIQLLGGENHSLFDSDVMKFMIPPFMIYIMAELVARFIHHSSDQKI